MLPNRGRSSNHGRPRSVRSDKYASPPGTKASGERKRGLKPISPETKEAILQIAHIVNQPGRTLAEIVWDIQQRGSTNGVLSKTTVERVLTEAVANGHIALPKKLGRPGPPQKHK